MTVAIATHAKETLDADLRKSAERSAAMTPQTTQHREVLPGIKERAYIPSLGRQGTGGEVTDVLLAAKRDRSEIDVPRTDRLGEVRSYRPAGAIEFSHGQLRLDVLLAIRWGRAAGLPTPNPVLDQILERLPGHLKEVYGEGLDTLAVCMHAPNPYLDDALAEMGIRAAPSELEEDKVGGWNLHLQVYVARAKDRKMQTPRHLFTHAGNSVVSSYQLRELGVDLDDHRASVLRASREPQYSLYLETGGKKGRALPTKIMRQWSAGKIGSDQAVAGAIALDLNRKDKSWAKAKSAKSLRDLNAIQVCKAKSAQAIDLLLADWFTDQLGAALVALDPRYAQELERARAVFPQLKQIQIKDGHQKSLNEILNAWERDQRAVLVRNQEAEIELVRAWAVGAPVAAYRQQIEDDETNGELAEIADYASRQSLEKDTRRWKKVVRGRDAQILALESARTQAEGSLASALEENRRLAEEIVRLKKNQTAKLPEEEKGWELWPLHRLHESIERIAFGTAKNEDAPLLDKTKALKPAVIEFIALRQPQSAEDKEYLKAIRGTLREYGTPSDVSDAITPAR